jgi:hypothetical protein
VPNKGLLTILLNPADTNTCSPYLSLVHKRSTHPPKPPTTIELLRRTRIPNSSFRQDASPSEPHPQIRPSTHPLPMRAYHPSLCSPHHQARPQHHQLPPRLPPLRHKHTPDLPIPDPGRLQWIDLRPGLPTEHRECAPRNTGGREI